MPKLKTFAVIAAVSAFLIPTVRAVELIAIGKISGSYEDFATETAAPLENGVPGNALGGLGSGLAYAGNAIFVALPDRGPNAKDYNSLVDNTSSYIVRFQTLHMSLAPTRDPVSGLPFTLTPMLVRTTLLSSPTPLIYGTGGGLGYRIDGVTPLGSGAPELNHINNTYYFTGRSDNFDPSKPSSNPANARLDPESIRISNNGRSVFISDEYGPCLYQFDRRTGRRIRSFKLPANLAITHLSPRKKVEIAENTTGRNTNKGMEGLAITPDGKMLVGIMQANLKQDKKHSVRIVTIDIQTGATHEYAYHLTAGSGVSDILAVNDHEFLVDERHGNGLGDAPLPTETASAAKVKDLFLIDLKGARDISNVSGPNADLSPYAVKKTLFLNIVAKLNAAGINSYLIPSKIEGIAFGQDVVINGAVEHTLYVANDNDFLSTVANPFKGPGDPNRGTVANPNQFYVFAFTNSELPGYVPQEFHERAKPACVNESKIFLP